MQETKLANDTRELNPVNLVASTGNLPVLSKTQLADCQIDMATFSDEQRRRINQISSNVTVFDSSSIMTFGAEPQQRMNGVLDQLLQGMKTCDVGVAGELTLELSSNIKAMHLSKMREEANGGDWVANTFGRVPVIGKYASAIRYFQLSHKDITDHLATIEQSAQREMAKLSANNSKLDRLVDGCLDNIKEIELYRAAGQVALERARQDFAAKKDEAALSRDPVKLTQLRDYSELINAFDTRLLRMHIAFTDSLIAVPQIRATQEAGRIEICNILDTILFDLPRLKRAIIQVASLEQIRRAQKTNDARRELTLQIGTLGADALQDAYTAAKSSQGNVADDLAVLSQTADKLLETLAMGARIDEENQRKREQGEIQLSQIKTKLLDGLVSSGDRLLGTSANLK